MYYLVVGDDGTYWTFADGGWSRHAAREADSAREVRRAIGSIIDATTLRGARRPASPCRGPVRRTGPRHAAAA